MANGIQKQIAETFLEMAQGLETGSFGARPKIALTGMGSEHGEENAMKAALEAAKDNIDVYYIGTLEAEGVTTIKVANDAEKRRGGRRRYHALSFPDRRFHRRQERHTRFCQGNFFGEYDGNLQYQPD